MRSVNQEFIDADRADRELRKFLTRTLKRPPTEQDIRNYHSEEHAKVERANKEREIKRQREREEEENTRRKRLNLLDERLRTRNDEPDGYVAIGNLALLEEHAKCGYAFCERTKIEGTKDAPIEIKSDLEGFNFRGSIFRDVVFKSGTNLKGATLSASTFSNVKFESDVLLEVTDFSEAEFNSAEFKDGCNLEGASFQFSKFKREVIIEFDRNYISNTTFSARRIDSWSTLSKSYAGIWQYINLTLSGAYFGFIILKLYLFKLISQIQISILDNLNISQAVQSELPKLSVFNFVFGAGFASVSIAILILIYQGLRLFMTTRINPLIEDEKRSSYTPSLSSYRRYKIPNRVVKILALIVVVLFTYELWELWNQEPLLFLYPKEKY